MNKTELKDYVANLSWMVGVTRFEKKPGQAPGTNPVEYNITVVSEGQYPNSSDSIIGRAFVIDDGKETEKATLSDAVGKWIEEKAPPPATPLKDAAATYFDTLKGTINPDYPGRKIISWDGLQVNETKKTGRIILMEELTVDSEQVVEFTNYAVWQTPEGVELRKING